MQPLETRGRSQLGRNHGGTQQIFLREGSPPRSSPYPFLYHFSRKRYPFSIPSVDKWYPFHIPYLELWILFNCFKCAVLLNKNLSQKYEKRFLDFIKTKKYLLALFGPFHTQMTDSSTLMFTSTSEIPTPFIYWNLKKIPLSGGASSQRPL